MQLTHLQDGRFTPVEVKRVLLVECNTRMHKGKLEEIEGEIPKKALYIRKRAVTKKHNCAMVR